MDFRPAAAADVPDVLPMVERIGSLHESWDAARYGTLPDFAERYRRWMTAQADNPTSVFLVAEREGKLVAFLIATTENEIPIYRLDRYGFIHDLWVDEQYRNEGIARQLVMLAIERFKLIGVKQIRLDTAGVNEVARKLFASCGFRVGTISLLAELSS